MSTSPRVGAKVGSTAAPAMNMDDPTASAPGVFLLSAQTSARHVMAATERQQTLEVRAQASCMAGDYDGGMTLLVQAYGPDLLRFLHARLGDAVDAEEVYAEVAVRLWRVLPRLEWRNGARGYCYAIARNCAISHSQARRKRRQREQALTGAPLVDAAVEQTRTATRAYLRTEVKERFRLLCEQLPIEDQTLLMLRLDRGLDYRELALMMTFVEVTPDDETLTREAARLRQRFKAAKAKVRRLAQQEGLLP